MASEPIHLSLADVTDIEVEFVMDAMRSGWITPLGPHVDAFEEEIASRVGVKHALALSSGTAALHLALIHLGVGPGTLVVAPSMTFAATVNAVAYCGATPVFVDSLSDDGNVDPQLMLHAVDSLREDGHHVSAAITVDLFGRSCDYNVLEAGLAERGVPLVEDAAEALGASFEGRAAGSFGVAAALSFNGNKIMTTSGGGMLLSNDNDLIGHARKLSTQAREPVPWYEHEEIGYNYRLSNVLAALGRGQLTRLDGMIARRKEIRQLYTEAFADLPVRVLGSPEDASHVDNHWLTSVVLESGSVDGLVQALNDQSIEARHVWKPMHMQPVFKDSPTFINGTSEALFRSGVNLPSGAGLTDRQVERVATAITEHLT